MEPTRVGSDNTSLDGRLFSMRRGWETIVLFGVA